jgi:hypothetical protein
MPGWAKGRGQPKWHEILYDKWKNMWTRVYTDIEYFGKTIQPKYKYFSGYVEDIMKLENFDLFKENPYGWSIDKDIKGGTHVGYYFEYLSLITQSNNSKDARARNRKTRSVIAIGEDILIFTEINKAKMLGFDVKHMRYYISKKKLHNGYRWYYINYNHGRRLRYVWNK